MKFNNSASQVQNSNQIANFEGGTSFTLNPKLHLYQLTASCFFNEPKFYGEIGDTERQIQETCQSIEDMEFVPKLAVYCREKMYLRTTPVVLMTEAWIKWGHKTNKAALKAYTERVLLRLDDMIEMFAYWKMRTGVHSMPNSLRKVIKKKLEEAGPYKMAKYASPRSEFKLKDLIIMTHPKGNFKEVIENDLKNKDTWEAAISTKGSSKETWEAILPKMGTLAFLRNLRNLEEHDVNVIESMHEKLTPENIRRGKIFPFQILSAYNAVDNDEIKSTLEGIIPYTYQNLPKIDGYTAIFSDVSGSMDSPLSSKSKMTYKEVAVLSGLLGSRIFSNSVFGIFSTEMAMVPYSPNDNILDKTRALTCIGLGGGTDAYKCIQYLLDTKTKVDRIVIFTDCITYNMPSYYGGPQVSNLIKEYRHKINKDCVFYNVDLSSYGMAMVNEGPNNYFINGWSDKIFEYFGIIEKMGRQDIDKLITEGISK